ANLEPLQKVLENPSLLRDRDLVRVEQFRADAIVVKNDHGTMELFKPQDAIQWKLYRDGKAQTADDTEVNGLLAALTAKRQIQSFPDPKTDEKTLGFDPPSAVVSLWEDGIKKDEKKDETNEKKTTEKEEKKEPEKKDANARPKLKSDKPTVKLTFGKRDK